MRPLSSARTWAPRTTHEILEKLREKADHKQIKNVDELKRLLKEEILAILTAADSQPVIQGGWNA